MTGPMAERPGIPGFAASPEDAVRNIDNWAQGLADKARRYREAQADTEALRLSATSPDGGVRVTVGADGGVTDLHLDERVRAVRASELAATIMETMRRAQSGIADRVSAVMADHLGADEDLHTRATVLTQLRDRFPDQADEPQEPDERTFEPVEDDPAPPPVARPAPVPDPPRRPRRPPGDPDDLDDGVDETHDPLRD
jgi:DNA-binding protein YbaB